MPTGLQGLLGQGRHFIRPRHTRGVIKLETKEVSNKWSLVRQQSGQQILNKYLRNEAPGVKEKEEGNVLLLWTLCQLQVNSEDSGIWGAVPSHSFSHTFPHGRVPNFPGTYGLGTSYCFNSATMLFLCPIMSQSAPGFTISISPASQNCCSLRAATAAVKSYVSYMNFMCMNT